MMMNGGLEKENVEKEGSEEAKERLKLGGEKIGGETIVTSGRETRKGKVVGRRKKDEVSGERM